MCGRDPEVPAIRWCADMMRCKASPEIGRFSGVLRFIGEERLPAMDLAAAEWGRQIKPPSRRP